jgi:hypothetical protein
MSPKKKPPRNPRRSNSDTEKRKRTIMRTADTDAANHYNIGGREKPAARKPSLPSRESQRKLDDDDGEEK